MNDNARAAIVDITSRLGASLFDDPNRLEAVLGDICAGDYRREQNVILTAARYRVPSALRSQMLNRPLRDVIPALATRLREDSAMDSDAAVWAVETIALAVGGDLAAT